MSTVDLTARWLSIFVEPGNGIAAGALTVTVPAGLETGTWTASVYADERRLTVLAVITVTPAGQVLGLTMTPLVAAGLVTAGMSRFVGHWDLTRTEASVPRTWLKGDFVVAAGKGAAR
jgi:hypothetical protein